MKKILTAVMLAVVAAQSAHAAIATPGSGNGELFFVIHNPTLQVSFTKDLGIGLETFLANGSDPSYSQAFNVADDGNWGLYNETVGGSLAGSFWAVMAFDSTGPSTSGGQRVLTTARSEAAGFEATAVRMRGTLNSRFSQMVGPNTQAFINEVNFTGSHGVFGQALNFAANGSSFNSITDPFPRAYFGFSPTGLTPSFNGNASFVTTSAVGEKALFAYMTRSGTGNGATAFATVTPFGNADVPYATWEFDGQTLAYAVPEPSTYALLGLGLAGLLAYTRRRQAV